MQVSVTWVEETSGEGHAVPPSFPVIIRSVTASLGGIAISYEVAGA